MSLPSHVTVLSLWMLTKLVPALSVLAAIMTFVLIQQELGGLFVSFCGLVLKQL